jgi:hypothetical protein
MNWFEELPPDCPPEQASPAGGRFFRLGSLPPKDEDFWSHRKIHPEKIFRVSECISRSVSIYDDLEAIKLMMDAFPNLRNRSIFEV